ncbi:MAG: tRNA pseudouridine(55) synthase TruB [Treponema sp.]|nr:tRNA pseudouridine(55) synthase TruB [Treponema sp.]
MENSGLILFNKPSGITSFDALRDIKRALGTGKVGHTGTLDKFASGLLIVLVGKALRLSKWFTHCDKKYEGRIFFGNETDTLDPEGDIIAKAPLPTRRQIEDTLPQFTGEIMQAPPSFSAIHIDGKRASVLAREGKMPEMQKRPVTIYDLKLSNWEPPFADIFVHCSSGTYIRSLARDIAIAAGSRAHLCELKRTQIAGFCLKETLAEAQRHREHQGKEKRETLAETQRRKDRREDEESFREYNLQEINKNVINQLGISWIEVTSQEADYIRHGKQLNILFDKKTFNSSASFAPSCLGENSSFNPSAPSRLGENSSLNPSVNSVVNSSLNQVAVFEGEKLVAIIEKTSEIWKYACVLG